MPPLKYCDVKQPNLNYHAGSQCPCLTCPLSRYSLPGCALNLLPAHLEPRWLPVSLRLQVHLYGVPFHLWSKMLAGDNTYPPCILQNRYTIGCVCRMYFMALDFLYFFIQLSSILHLCVTLNTLLCRLRKKPAGANLNTHNPRGADQCVVLGFC